MSSPPSITPTTPLSPRLFIPTFCQRGCHPYFLHAIPFSVTLPIPLAHTSLNHFPPLCSLPLVTGATSVIHLHTLLSIPLERCPFIILLTPISHFDFISHIYHPLPLVTRNTPVIHLQTLLSIPLECCALFCYPSPHISHLDFISHLYHSHLWSPGLHLSFISTPCYPYLLNVVLYSVTPSTHLDFHLSSLYPHLLSPPPSITLPLVIPNPLSLSHHHSIP